jgi:hypothetical protein
MEAPLTFPSSRHNAYEFEGLTSRMRILKAANLVIWDVYIIPRPNWVFIAFGIDDGPLSDLYLYQMGKIVIMIGAGSSGCHLEVAQNNLFGLIVRANNDLFTDVPMARHVCRRDVGKSLDDHGSLHLDIKRCDNRHTG